MKLEKLKKLCEVEVMNEVVDKLESLTVIKRNGKNGEFYGCRNYPKCHYTKQL